MRIDVLTLFPDMFPGPLDISVIGRGKEQGLFDLFVHDIRSFASDRHKTVDDTPFGGGQGMVLRVDILELALNSVQALAEEKGQVIYLSPQGERLTDSLVRDFSKESRLILVAGRYEGVDERFIENFVDREISIGDYVLSGGELPIMVLIEAMVRQIPGVLGDADSAKYDSFADGLLEYPQYTRPATFNGWSVPDVLLSGHHAEISKWREEQRYKRTLDRRPDLLDD
ncbi:MAG: tRNA (guanosine(37)-N1)-methyltransferase TrmD [Dehalococcoidia bacterium]|nr:tRNA (guanosine(37)-N1)-methyltransferase TrmD [Dehalococcoidia bacterium]